VHFSYEIFDIITIIIILLKRHIVSEQREQKQNNKPGFEQIRDAVGAPETAGHHEVIELFDELSPKAGQDLLDGFTAWVKENDLGSTVVYETDARGTRFVVNKMLIDGQVVRSQISGEYATDNNKVNVSVDQETGSPFVTCRVYLNGSLLANRTSPFDVAGQQADAFTRNLVEANEGDASRLDETIRDERSPYPFAVKMLSDFTNATPDQQRIGEMAEKMQKTSIVVLNKDYLASQ
jgi:hypothetical protein